MKVLLIILAILLCIFMLPIKVNLTYNGGIRASLKFFFFRFQIIPKKNKKRMSKKEFNEEVKKSKKNKVKKQKKNAQKTVKTRKYSADDIPFYFELIKDFLAKTYNSVRRGLTVKIKSINVVVGTDDAAKTAIAYGVISQSVAYLLQFLDSIAKVSKTKSSKISVTSDFLSDQTDFDFNIDISWKLWRALFILLSTGYRALISILAHQNHTKNKIVTNSNKAKAEEK